jgi:hypothetical protein
MRCEAANVFCAGYEQMRRIEARRLRHDTPCPNTEQPVLEHVWPADISEGNRHYSSPKRPYEGSSLAPLPSSPRPGQSLGPGARHVLGYHHFLSRTLPLLFPREDMYFWRDMLCQEAWGHEYIHLSLTALGNLHRGVIMMAAPEETAQQSGLAEKLNAVRQYTQALQELSSHLDEAKDVPEVLIGVLCLMAYFEVCSEVTLLLITQHDLSDDPPVIQRQSACLCRACKGCLPLPTDSYHFAPYRKWRVHRTHSCPSGHLFTFARSDMSHGCAIPSPLITSDAAPF